MTSVPSNMLPLGTKAPTFELPDVVSGTRLRLASLQSDKATVIMFIIVAFNVNELIPLNI